MVGQNKNVHNQLLTYAWVINHWYTEKYCETINNKYLNKSHQPRQTSSPLRKN